MKDKKDRNDLFISSHLMMILTYTIFSMILVGETIVMDWEKWAIVLIVLGVGLAWYIHLSGIGDDRLRLWLCSVLMMATFFFYGTHETSTFDLAVVICVVMILYTMTGIASLVTFCQLTYYVTMTYELVQLAEGGTSFDSLLVTRTMLHFAVVTMTGWIARTIIVKWKAVMGRADEEIMTLNESATRLNDFIANVSHEIRTPINAILGMCDMCLHDEENAEKRANLTAIEEAGRRMGIQISDILDYSEVDRGDIVSNCEDYMLASLLNDLVNEIRPYRRNDIELVIDVDPSIPAVMNTDVGKLKKILWHLIINGLKFTKEGGVYVHISCVPHDYGINLCLEVTDTGIGMDEKQLEKIYDSFYVADSGRDRMTGGLGLGMIIVHGFVKSLGGFMTVSSTPDVGTTVRVSIPNKVADPGRCMSLADREGVSLGAYLHFEKYPNPNVREFYDKMVRNIVTGLGVKMHRVDNNESLKALTDNKKLTHLFAGPEEYINAADFIEELAGSIIVTVIANPEELKLPPGSRVRIMPKPFYCFPVVGVINSKPDDAKPEEGQIMFKGARVLVVDDEPMNLIVSAGLLKRYGMIVTTCSSGPEAIDLCRNNDYDVIFMDHMMPGMDGVEAMKRIRSERTKMRDQIPVIAFTANAISSAREMFRQVGFDGFVSKPVDTVELERVLRRVLPSVLISFDKKRSAEIYHEVAAPVKAPAAGDSRDVLAGLAAIGVDTAQGLFYCQNDKEFYNTLLIQYAKESVSKKRIMSEALKSGDMKSYSIQVHAIKSSSKMIGAMSLSEYAKRLEEAAKGGDESFVTANHDAMLAKYDRVIEAIGATDGADEEDILEFAPVGADEEGGEE